MVVRPGKEVLAEMRRKRRFVRALSAALESEEDVVSSTGALTYAAYILGGEIHEVVIARRSRGRKLSDCVYIINVRLDSVYKILEEICSHIASRRRCSGEEADRLQRDLRNAEWNLEDEKE